MVQTVRRAIDRSLPREPSVEPLAEVDLLPATAARIRDLRALGFEPLGGPHVANLSQKVDPDLPTVTPRWLGAHRHELPFAQLARPGSFST